MPQRRSLLDKPIDLHTPNLPEGDPNAPEAMINRFIGGVTQGVNVPQRSGASNEMPELFGNLATMLPISELLAALRGGKKVSQATNLGDAMLRNHELPAEFAPTTVGQRPDLDPGELQKMIDMLKNRSQGQGGPVK